MIFRILLLVSLIIPSTLLAQDSSQFLVSVVGGEDTTPPTPPVLTSVTPTAATQIDITWSASTDDVVVSGYVLMRDGTPIATTTLTSYTDTGLTPETLYTYEAYAFDGFNNISSTSNQLATTTLAVPVTPVATSTSSGSSATLVFMLLGLDINEKTTEVKIDWRTSKPSRYSLRWGRGDSYDVGYVINDTYRGEHSTTITQLEPGTTYQYELIGYSANGETLTLRRGEFKTKSIESTVPLNVLGFFGRQEGSDVVLEWMLPADFAGKVRVVRSHLGYPGDLYDGAIVFDSEGVRARDVGILSRYDEVFYTAFVILPDGSVSSGAVAKVRARSSEGGSDLNETPQVEVLPEVEAPLTWNFDRSHINLIQKDGVYSFATNSKPILTANDSFLVRIPFKSVPNNLKSIVATLTDPADPKRAYAFLLRINKDGTFYEATVPPILFSGDSLLTVEIYDYERMVVGRYAQIIQFVADDNEYDEVIFPDKIVGGVKPFLPWAGVAVLVLSIFLVVWRLRDEDKV